MKFYYKKYGAGVVRPVIPVEIIANGRKVRYEALIDSGADECIFDAQLAEILGINFRKGEKRMVGGITGVEEQYYLHRVTLSVGGWGNEIRVGFMPNMPEFGYGVLGQRGFFENFVVIFDYALMTIELKPQIKN